MIPQKKENTVSLNLISKHHLVLNYLEEEKADLNPFIIFLCLENSDKF